MFSLTNELRSLAILLPKRHIFLLSHMRAYTSLFGHIMGSNPEICGYYEMHIGYHSWKSLIRQKLLYRKTEVVKPHCLYMFDKVLHNDHGVASGILNRPGSFPIFSLRHPEQSIPSIVKLYNGIDPFHEFCSPGFASQYYVGRLAVLEKLARSMNRPFFYLDSEALVEQPEVCLGQLSEWLQLKTPLSSNYELQNKTSVRRYGDTSAQLKAGQVMKRAPTGEDFQVDSKLLGPAIDGYLKTRKTLAEASSMKVLVR